MYCHSDDDGFIVHILFRYRSWSHTRTFITFYSTFFMVHDKPLRSVIQCKETYTIYIRYIYTLYRATWSPTVELVLSVLLWFASFLPSVVWTRTGVCSFAANPFNARFHSKLFKAAAHTHLRNFDLLCERERGRGSQRERTLYRNAWLQYHHQYHFCQDTSCFQLLFHSVWNFQYIKVHIYLHNFLP